MKAFKDRDIWLEYARRTSAPKFITGLRGIGKTMLLHKAREQMLAEGIPENNILLLNTEDASLRRYCTHTQMLDYIIDRLPRSGRSHILVKEASGLPTPEVVMGTLAATSRFEVYATSSSRRLLDQGLKDYFAGQIMHLNLFPEERTEGYAPVEASARWNEIFLYDVLSPNHILELPIINRLVGWLSDNLGDPLSLRQISNAVSPAGRLLSPHTINAYLTALEDSHLVEKVIRWDTAEDAPRRQTTGTSLRTPGCDSRISGRHLRTKSAAWHSTLPGPICGKPRTRSTSPPERPTSTSSHAQTGSAPTGPCIHPANSRGLNPPSQADPESPVLPQE